MAKDYRVPHYKKDDVDHNSITIDTWQHQKEKLEPYLRHDCLSLLEVLDRHSTVIFNATYCEKHEWNKDECHTLNVLEELVMGSSFKKCRKLPWLKCPRDNKTKLELDGFDANLGLAVEVQSREHYKFNHFFHKNEDGFQLQQERDRAKLLACNNNNVHLIVVPYTECKSKEKLVTFLSAELAKTDFPLANHVITDDIYNAKRVIQSGHLCMTQCMTASGLSKRWFYHSFYDKKSFPIFTLTPEQDSFIRDQSYLGGRVELFKLGLVNEKVKGASDCTPRSVRWLFTTPILTLPVDVGCLSFYEFWDRENSLEKRVRCRKARNVSVSAESLQVSTKYPALRYLVLILR